MTSSRLTHTDTPKRSSAERDRPELLTLDFGLWTLSFRTTRAADSHPHSTMLRQAAFSHRRLVDFCPGRAAIVQGQTDPNRFSASFSNRREILVRLASHYRLQAGPHRAQGARGSARRLAPYKESH